MKLWNGGRLLFLLRLPLLATCVDPVVDLGYARYRGRVVGDGTTQWLGMRYAAAPLGRLRFAGPQDPARVEGVQDATKVWILKVVVC